MSGQGSAHTAASIQQIKYDCLAYLKEFGRETKWIVDAVAAPEETVRQAGLDLERDPWLWRAALSRRAARSVADFLCARFGSEVAPGEAADGPYVVLYRRNPHAA